MLELTDENMKYLGLGLALLLTIYVYNLSRKANDRIIEGFSHSNGSNSVNYKTSLKNVSTLIHGAQKKLVIKNSGPVIKDILTNLMEMAQLGRLSALLKYSQGNLDSTTTNKIAQVLKSLKEIELAINSSTKYVDSVAG